MFVNHANSRIIAYLAAPLGKDQGKPTFLSAFSTPGATSGSGEQGTLSEAPTVLVPGADAGGTLQVNMILIGNSAPLAAPVTVLVDLVAGDVTYPLHAGPLGVGETLSWVEKDGWKVQAVDGARTKLAADRAAEKAKALEKAKADQAAADSAADAEEKATEEKAKADKVAAKAKASSDAVAARATAAQAADAAKTKAAKGK